MSLLNTALKVKNRTVVHVGVFALLTAGLIGSCIAATQRQREDPTTYHGCLGKDQALKFQVRFLLNVYHFHTIVKSKNGESNHCKSGAIYSSI